MKKLFNTGLEKANLIVQSGVLQLSWDMLVKNPSSSLSSSSSSSSSLTIEVNENRTVISFATSQAFGDECSGNHFDLFKFRAGKINEAAITLFKDHKDTLLEIIKDIDASKAQTRKPLIITGQSLGGSIASLFTLLLLDSVDFSDAKPPICITFGSPLIGDADLQKYLYKYTSWTSNFLHVVSNQDPVPRMFTIDDDSRSYVPFGTFLLCSKFGGSCFEDPETVLKLLVQTASQGQDRTGVVDYGIVVKNLKQNAVFKRMVDTDWCSNPYHAGAVIQLSALGLFPNPQPQDQDQARAEITALTEEMEKMEMKYLMGNRTVKPNKKLSDSKTNMAKLEWYMKLSKEIGYYDTYKNMRYMGDINIQEVVKRLIIYWTDVVEDADKRPQAVGENLRMRWLYSGYNYLRMVEPLYIAEYYHHHEKGVSGYVNNGRLPHFNRLKNLVVVDKSKKKKSEVSIPIEDDKKKRIGSVSFNEDSCFWANVEDALILCSAMKREGASDDEKQGCVSELKKFEDYVFDLIERYDVSPEIFLKHSSFMTWWEEYKEAMGNNHDSKLVNIMVPGIYKKYSKGEL